MSATTRTITDTIYKLDGTPWTGATVRINRVDRPMLDSDGTIGDSAATGTTDENGDVTLTVAVPPSGAGRYLLTRPVETGRPVDVTYFYLAAGDPISVGEILAASASALTEDAVLTLLSSYLSKANNLSDLASAATARTNLGLGTAATAAAGDFEAAGAVAAHTGDTSAAHAASAISVAPAGELTATDVQTALAELQGDIDGMGGGDVGDLTTTSGSSTNMLRVAAAGGLEYRTTAQVLSDIGAAPTASPTFSGTVTAPTIVGGVIKPSSDSTTALQLANAAGTAVLTVNTTNKLVNINSSRTDAALTVNPNSLRNGIFAIGETSGAYQNGFEVDVTGTTGSEVRGFTLQARVKTGNTVNSVFGGYIAPAVVSGTASLVAGLKIGDQTGGTFNYSIYTGTGKVRLGDTINFAGTMGNSTKTVGTDAPADWVEVQIGGTTYYLPAYAA